MIIAMSSFVRTEVYYSFVYSTHVFLVQHWVLYVKALCTYRTYCSSITSACVLGYTILDGSMEVFSLSFPSSQPVLLYVLYVHEHRYLKLSKECAY
jgi:hypothetical protein